MFSLHAVKKSVSHVCCLGLFTLAAHSVYAAEAAPIKMGVEPWLGYGQWHIASAKDLFAKSGLNKVEVINFAEDKDINAALASGQIDAANIATHTAMGMISAGLPVKIVLVLDQDLKGKQVAYEEGTTSDILLRSALASAGLSFSDIKPVPMPAASAGSAILAGRVPVAVTYEPYLTVAKKSDPSIKMLYSGSSDPGLISDVLVVRDDFIKSHPDEIKALIKTWGAALDFYNANTTEGRAIISKAVGATPADLDTAFDGVKYFTLSENKAYLSHDFTTKTFPHILKAATDAGIVTQPVTPAQTIDAEFANQQ